MTKRFSREYGAHLHVAQEAKRADHANLDFADVPIQQPAERNNAYVGPNIGTGLVGARGPDGRPTAGSSPAIGSPSKYRNVRTDGYASAREAKRAAVLGLLQDTKVISGLREQVEFVLIPRQLDEHGKVAERACIYRADFVYTDNATGKEIVEDSKGVRTADYIIKRKLMRMQGIVIRET